MPGFMSSSVALTVYKLQDVQAVTAEKLQQFAFRSIDDIPEPKGWGWVNIDDMFDAEWRVSGPEKGDFICFGFRVDTRRVSGGVLRKHLAEAMREEEAKAAAEGTKVKRSRKKELKEQFAAKLLSQAEPVPMSTDVAVDTSTGLMYVAANSAAVLELLESHFEASFGAKLDKLEADPAQGTNLLRVIYEHGLTVAFGEHEYTLGEGGRGSLVHPESGAHVSAKDEPDSTDVLPNPVTLRPWRTFPEVEQPASKFVFRAKEGPSFALIEADGGAWKGEAMRNIKAWLEVKVPGLNIIA